MYVPASLCLRGGQCRRQMFDAAFAAAYHAAMKYRRVLCAVLLSLPVHAEDADQQRIMAALANATQSLAPKVQAVLAQQQRAINSACPLRALTPDEVVVTEVPAFNLDGLPERGDWVMRYIAKACKETVIRTAAFHATPKGIEVAASAPGATRVDARLAADVWESFQKAAIRAKPRCKDMTLRDTQLVEAPAGSAAIWREAWMARVCGTDMGQIISFYPTPRGTLFRMSLPGQTLPENGLAPNYAPVK